MDHKKNEILTVITPEQSQKNYVKDLYSFRELFYFLAWRDILVRYRQTFLGVIWALVRPVLNMAVFAFVFGRIAHLSSDSINYPLFVLSGMIIWQMFSCSLIDTSQCLVLNAPMISKVYFPRLIVPASNIIVHFIDFMISFTLLLVLFMFMGYLDQWTLIFSPIFILMTVFLSLGAGLWFAAASVRFRDFRFLVPFLVQFGVFVSPVGYSSFLLSEKWQWIYFLNPIAGIIEGFRWCCFGVYHEGLPLAVTLSVLMNALVFITGFRFFRQMERVFADII